MSRVIKSRGKQQLPGGGFDANGNSKQGKLEVWGKIEVTNYNTGGENLSPSDVGLRTIEWIDLKHDEALGGASGSEVRTVHYSYSAQQFYVLQENSGGNFVQVAPTADPDLSFHVTGDSIDDVELV